ncbi:MAG: ABC transporter permease [Oscillospiraceae bacterium]|nr:ABC transporter permease [Oscillospiraceae bacterium]
MKISSIGYLVKEGLRSIWANRMMSLASIGVLVSCLVLTGAAVMVSMNVESVVDKVGDSNVTTVYMEDNASDELVTQVGEKIKDLKNVTEVSFFAKEDAIKDYKDVLGDKVFAEMENDNPLPDAYKVTVGDLAKYDETVKSISAIEGVATVSSQTDVADKLTSLNKMVQILSMGIVLALVIISLFIISNTIRMTMYARRFEISIMKSVGATNMFVRIPFLIEGMFIGVISGVISLFGLMLVYDVVVEAMQYVVPFKAIDFNTILLPFALAFIVAGMAVGMLGGLISIGKYLKKEGSIILGW